MNGFVQIVPELIRSNGDDLTLHVDFPQNNNTKHLFLVTQDGCPACDRIKRTLQEMQQDINTYFPAIVYILKDRPRFTDDVNHYVAMAELNVMNVPTLFLVNKKKKLLPFPLIKCDGTTVPHLVNLSKEDIYHIWST